ncbi:MAG: hypothetical protein AAF657_25005 [Acidobacteriota bacterium]
MSRGSQPERLAEARRSRLIKDRHRPAAKLAHSLSQRHASPRLHALARLTLARLTEAARRIEAEEPPTFGPGATAGAADVDEFVRKSVESQLRAVRRGKVYRTHAFARAYLQHLGAYRYDHGDKAARLVTGVVVNLLPHLPGPRRECLALLCLGLGVFGSARRLKGHFSVASRAFQQALAVARRAGLQADEGNLLMRASYVLSDHGHFRRALALLKEALVLFVRLGSRRDIGRVLVDPGMFARVHAAYSRFQASLEQSEVQVILIHHDRRPFVLELGERMAQLLVARVEAVEWQEAADLSASERGAGGFGSSGRG